LEPPLRSVFLEDLYGAGGASGSGAGASSTTGSTTGSGAAGAGAAFLPPNRSPNLDIAFIEYFYLFIRQQVLQTHQESSYSFS